MLMVVSAGLCGEVGGPSRRATFVHPGLLHSRDDLEGITKNVHDGVEPWASAWQALQRTPWLVKTYRPAPLAVVGRGVGSTGQRNISGDCTAAYYNAVAWSITDDPNYAKKAIEILDGWAYTCKEINGKDAVLCAGLYGVKFVNAAEIIRYTYKDWPANDIAQFETLMKTVFYPVVEDFATFANGNWDACCLPTMMSIGVFCDDRAMFDRAVRYYLAGSGNGSLTRYIVNKAGQCQESGRDQAHTQLGLGLLAEACEIGYHQGIDMYAAADHRLLKGFEYTAKYNLGHNVPFEPYRDRTGKYFASTISSRGRGRLSPIYEMVYNHFKSRLGMDVPFTEQAAAKTRPERWSIDQPGAGTLLFTLPSFAAPDRPPPAAPAVPGPVIAKSTPSANVLTWVVSLHATSYTVKRATRNGGPYKNIAKGIKWPSYTDPNVTAGQVYYYAVSASNAAGESPDTLEVSIYAGLPGPWSSQDVGSVSVPGSASCDDRAFTVEAAGADIGGAADQFHFAYTPMASDGTITARYVPQTASQFAKMGLMMRESLTGDCAHVSLLLIPQAMGDVEQPGWSARLVSREAAGANTAVTTAGVNLPAPYATWDRLMKPYWLRLSRQGNVVAGSVSPDGQTWIQAGAVTIPLPRSTFIGLAVCSRLAGATTLAAFDNVTLAQPPQVSGQGNGGRVAIWRLSGAEAEDR
jgi:hypothetical protein